MAEGKPKRRFVTRRARTAQVETKAPAAVDVPVAREEPATASTAAPAADTEPARPPLRYLSDPEERRQALADIIVCRIKQEPIPPHLAMNDNLAFTNMTRVNIIRQVMAQEGATLDQARDYALRSIQ